MVNLSTKERMLLKMKNHMSNYALISTMSIQIKHIVQN